MGASIRERQRGMRSPRNGMQGKIAKTRGYLKGRMETSYNRSFLKITYMKVI